MHNPYRHHSTSFKKKTSVTAQSINMIILGTRFIKIKVQYLAMNACTLQEGQVDDCMYILRGYLYRNCITDFLFVFLTSI